MKIFVGVVSLLLSPVVFTLPVSAAQNALPRRDIVVSSGNQCPGATFHSIGDAVDAAQPGDDIRVCAGMYAEQVVVDKALHIEADSGAIVMPSNVTANGTDLTSGEALAAIFLVKDTQADVEGFILDGANNEITECSPRLIGILYQDASGNIRHNAIRRMSLSASLNGCQSGNGIEVQTSPGNSSSLRIEDNSVQTYQKNGITANDDGTMVAIRGNVVTGIGPTPGAAQNGIQVGFGAKGTVDGNIATDNVWSSCLSLQQCESSATGILVFQSDGVEVRDNVVGTNQVGIFIGGGKARVDQNEVFNSQVLDGIVLSGDKNEARENRIAHSDQAAVVVEGNANTVQANTITDAGIGILKGMGFTGNAISGNRFFATPIFIQDPTLYPSAHALVQEPASEGSARVSPVR
ncbi:MAG: right-handed parallel beta-helix repeat-containing protein [Candidatus Acidiferrales bacterium]